MLASESRYDGALEARDAILRAERVRTFRQGRGFFWDGVARVRQESMTTKIGCAGALVLPGLKDAVAHLRTYLKKAPLTTALKPPVQMTLILTWPERFQTR